MTVDRDKLRELVCELDEDDLLVLLDRAIELLSDDDLPAFFRDYAQPTELRPEPPEVDALLGEIERFHTDTLAGVYYEDFNVNSRNWQEKSEGTKRWISECERLLDTCIQVTEAGPSVELQACFESLFALLAQIDGGDDSIIFFADEAGSWQVGVDWREVMPAWFRCLSVSAKPADYAARVHALIGFFALYDAKKLVSSALKIGTVPQRTALSALPPPKRIWPPPDFLCGG